jgi:phosphoribosylamine--glycine ligase
LHDAEAQVQSMMIDKRFGQAGTRVVIEELLVGREASFFVLSDGRRAIPVGSAEDHKRALDGDTGPNTGGMGAYAPSALFDAAMQTRVMNEIVHPVLEGMRSEGSEFRGVLFVGLMLTAGGPNVIEFNVRFGDPEVILPMITDDLSMLLMSAAAGDLLTPRVSFDTNPRVGIVLASGGYPDTYETGKVIQGLDTAEAIPDVNVFHSGTAKRGTDIVTAGGRVLTIVAPMTPQAKSTSMVCTIAEILRGRH